MRIRTITVDHETLPVVLNNIRKYRGFANHFGINSEQITVYVSTNDENQFQYTVQVPGHVYSNMKASVEKQLLLEED